MFIFIGTNKIMLSNLLEYPSDFVRLFYPRICGGCETALVKGEQHLCLHCRMELPFTTFENIKDNPVERIFYGRVMLEFATSLLFYSKGTKVQHILHQIKYNDRKELAVFLGNIFAQRLQNNPYLKDVSVIIPVPLHPQKLHVRGYNQSALFAEGIQEVWNIPVHTTNLVRIAETASQTQKSKIERWENVAAAFKLKNPTALKDKHILLVDDVLTTGATLEACANTILNATPCKVSVATIAIAMH